MPVAGAGSDNRWRSESRSRPRLAQAASGAWLGVARRGTLRMTLGDYLPETTQLGPGRASGGRTVAHEAGKWEGGGDLGAIYGGDQRRKYIRTSPGSGQGLTDLINP